MSRTLNATEEFSPGPYVNRAGLMLDEMTVFQQDPTDTTYTGWEPGGEEEAESIGSALGQELYGPNGDFLGTLRQSSGGGLYIVSGKGTTQKWIPFTGGTYILDAGLGKRFHVALSPTGDIIRGATSTTAAPSGPTRNYAAEQAEADAAAMDRLLAQLEAEEDEAKRNRDWGTAERIAGEIAAAQAAKLAAENQLKLSRLGEAGALARTFEDIKSRARDVIAGMMGKNVFRGAVRARGGVPRGVDPYEAFEAELGGVANMPTPQFSSESNLGQLDAAIAAMNQTQMPTSPWPMGMAGGGTVRPGEVVKVGELGEEYVYNVPGSEDVEIIPEKGLGARVAGSAAQGGTYEFDKSSIAQVLGPAYSYLGFSQAPEFKSRQPMTAESLQRLGIRPRLVRSPSGAVSWVDPEGVRHGIPSATQFRDYGFDWADVVDMSGADIMGMYGAQGSALTSAPPLIEPYQGGYPRQAVPLGFGKAAGELGHYALPDPRTIANLFRTFDPANRKILIDALGLSEMGTEQISSLLRAFTPQGTAGRVGYG